MTPGKDLLSELMLGPANRDSPKPLADPTLVGRLAGPEVEAAVPPGRLGADRPRCRRGSLRCYAQRVANTNQPTVDFDRSSEPILGLPPIVGNDGGSVWCKTPAHVRIERLNLPAALESGLYVGVDIHLDSRAEQVVLGTSRTRGTALVLKVNANGVPGRVSLMLRDEDGRTLEGYADGSRAIARRLIVVARPADDAVTFYELEPWASPDPVLPLLTHLIAQDSPSRFAFDSPAALGGWYEDGIARGPFAGRLSEVFLGTGQPSVEALAAASGNQTGLTHSGLADPSDEILALFRRGFKRLHSWTARPMNVDDMDAASVLMFSWLFDVTPVLVRLAQCYGIQLWMPGTSERARQYEEEVLRLGAVALIQGSRGPGSAMGFTWTTLDEWRHQPVLHAQGHSVSAEQFIKFVRNKLGGGHFDEVDRREWQKRLLETMAAMEIADEEALVFQMRQLASQVLLAASVARLGELTGAP